ncbi:N-methyltransferase homolog [Halobacterium salinarum NRC-1]|uniref:N-methyltransferase homolog n=5 Tax=Halobacterium salinarum TaxID=2242 RepID=Q9HSC9_HALSA|nr:N-methyltransferase homolog [Halobacterium salinarum NRC-1]
MLAERGADITGLDISGPMLQEGRQKAAQAGVADTIEFMRGDAGRLPFPDNHFDSVFAMRFFHLADSPATYLREMARVSKQQVFFDTFNRFSTRSLYNWLLPMGSRLYGSREVRALVSGAGLTLADADHDFIAPYGFYREVPDWIARPFRNADVTLGDTPLGEPLASVSYWDVRL